MDITVRPARPEDAAFLATGNVAMALEAEHKVLDPGTVDLGVRAVLEGKAAGRYFVAERSGRPVGQLMITYEWSDWRNGCFWWIQSVYVLHEARRGGVFRALYRNLELAARTEGGVCGIRLYVDRDNAKAIETYRRCGLTDAGYAVMEVDYSGAVHTTGGSSHA